MSLVVVLRGHVVGEGHGRTPQFDARYPHVSVVIAAAERDLLD
jgi:hypothetical protein